MDFRDHLPDVPEGRIVWYATIAKDATDLSDLLPVVIPEYDPALEWGPCRWQARDAVSLPNKGDRCLVIFDNRNQPWITAWWPFTA